MVGLGRLLVLQLLMLQRGRMGRRLSVLLWDLQLLLLLWLLGLQLRLAALLEERPFRSGPRDEMRRRRVAVGKVLGVGANTSGRVLGG